MSDKKHNFSTTSYTDPGMIVYNTGHVARTMSRGEGIRMFLPFRVTLECQLSPLSEACEVFEFYLYQEDANAAIKIASKLLKVWYQLVRKPVDGFPKPVGMGEARRIEDKEFIARHKEAVEKGKDVKVNGDKNDPVAFVITRPKGLIIIPAAPQAVHKKIII